MRKRKEWIKGPFQTQPFKPHFEYQEGVFLFIEMHMGLDPAPRRHGSHVWKERVPWGITESDFLAHPFSLLASGIYYTIMKNGGL